MWNGERFRNEPTGDVDGLFSPANSVAVRRNKAVVKRKGILFKLNSDAKLNSAGRAVGHLSAVCVVGAMPVTTSSLALFICI